MAGANVTIAGLYTDNPLGASGALVLPAMAQTTGSQAGGLTLDDVRTYVGVVVGTGAPTATTYTHPSVYLRTDGSTTNDRAYITTSTGGWVAFITAS
jgi:hypothetical protein